MFMLDTNLTPDFESYFSKVTSQKCDLSK
jgi:hypothetical protein